MIMRKQLVFLALALACARSYAAVPPPEKLLPRETMLVITAPDAPKYWASFNGSTYGRVWNDPAMKPFRDKLTAKLRSDIMGPVERQLGVKLDDYSGLAQGQFTFALLREEGSTDFSPLLLIDAKERSEKLKAALSDARKKWVAAGKQLKTEQIHGIEFTTLIATSGELSNSIKNIFSDNKGTHEAAQSNKSGSAKADDSARESEKIQVLVGQSDSLLIVSYSKKVIEKVLALQTGGLAPSLDQEPLFQSDFASGLRDSTSYIWLNAKAMLASAGDGDQADSSNPANMSAKALVAATGLASLNTVSCAWRETSEGFSSQIVLRMPERAGLFKALLPDAKESSPPPFVPADAIKFVRWRVDLPETWDTMEKLLGKINPGAKDAINFMLKGAGKTRDEKYDLRAELVGALGNDVITYQKIPRGNAAAALASSPSIFLIGSPKPELLAAAVRVAAESFSPTSTIKESDFLGRKLYSLGGADSRQSLNFAPSGGYVAFSSDITMIEEYLRGADEKTKPLSAVPGLSEAAQKVGGMGTGLFGYNNQVEELRVAFENWRKNGASPAIPALSGGKGFNPSEWVDVSLLPPFESVAKYFSFVVYAGRSISDGYVITFFVPSNGK